jgi:hypothetical protein
MARSVLAPKRCISRITGSTFAAWRSACWLRVVTVESDDTHPARGGHFAAAFQVELWFGEAAWAAYQREGGYMGKSDLFARVAECERALHVASDADRRSGLERLRKVWLALAYDQQLALDPEMQEAISALRRLHARMITARPTLH